MMWSKYCKFVIYIFLAELCNVCVCTFSESPFHLARRGWGEFPLRVRIVFKDRLNKPVDVIHNLKLDKTYTGRQTLGNKNYRHTLPSL